MFILFNSATRHTYTDTLITCNSHIGPPGFCKPLFVFCVKTALFFSTRINRANCAWWTNLQRDHYRLRVRASDKGDPPSYADVEVELDVVDRNNKPPIWDQSVYGPIRTRENVVVGTRIASVKARFVFEGGVIDRGRPFWRSSCCLIS